MKVKQYKHINQFHIYGLNNGVWCDILQSYNSVVIKIEKQDKITLGCDWDYSTTTLKHVYDFLEEYGNVYFTKNNTKKRQIENMIEQHKIVYDSEMM